MATKIVGTFQLNRQTIFIAALALVPLALSSCVNSESLFNASDSQVVASSDVESSELEGFQGCITGTALDTSRIKVEFEFPDGASKMSLYRDGILIASFTKKMNILTYTDIGLQEGESYRYTCEGNFNGIPRVGDRMLEVSTFSENAPDFEGIQSVTAIDARSVKVKWKSAKGVAVSEYRVYAQVGGSLDMATATPVKTTSIGTSEVTLSNLGDELPYTFGVSACSSVGNCDTADKTLPLTLGNGGAALTTGATAASVSGSSVLLTVPWSHSQGAVKKRKVYVNTSGTNLTAEAPYKIEIVSDITNPATQITVSQLAENTLYYFLVQDEDPSGTENTNSAIVSINTGDLTAPIFGGVSGLSVGNPSDKAIVVQWSAINSQFKTDGTVNDLNGATHYLVYLTSADYPTTPSDPCDKNSSSRTLKAQVEAKNFAPPQMIEYNVPPVGDSAGLLQPRTIYKACVTARDLAGNESSHSTPAYQIITKDLTAPSFDGIQSLVFNATPPNAAPARFEAGWNPSPSADIKEYRVQVWKNTTSPAPGDITTFVRAHAQYSTGFNFANSDFAFNEGDTVYVKVNACDDASPTFGSQNCTALTQTKNSAVPDMTPPQFFGGIKEVNNTADTIPASTEGAVKVVWYPAAGDDWSDYQGFYIYLVNADNSLSPVLKNCSIAGIDCSLPGNLDACTSCTVSGLDAYRTYKFHVRAYDANLNETQYLDPAQSFVSKRTLDKTPPTFASELSLTFVNGTSTSVDLAWIAATYDNQYDAGATITYAVYRKAGSTFAINTIPGADGTLLSSGLGTLTYEDPLLALTEGETYYYAVCARDASENETCDGNIKSKLIPDSTAPTIGDIGVTWPTQKSWSLSWTMSDPGGTAQNLILVKILRKIAATDSDFPAEGGPVEEFVSSTYGTLTLPSQGNIPGTGNADKYVNYRIIVQDQQGNKASATKAVRIDNGPATNLQLALAEGVTNFAAGGCGQVTMNLRGADTGLAALETSLAVSLASNVAGIFYSDAGCSASIGTSLTLAAWASTKDFYFKTNVATASLTLTASATGLTNGTVSLAVLAAEADHLVLSAGVDNQRAAINTALSTAPEVKVVDLFGNAIGSHGVTFRVTLGGGKVGAALTETTINTDASTGLGSTPWTLGPSIGMNSLAIENLTLPGTPNSLTISAEAFIPPSINPTSAVLFPNEEQLFVGSGGSGTGYVYSGSDFINADSTPGLYKVPAGTSARSETVRVTDSENAFAEALVRVAAFEQTDHFVTTGLDSAVPYRLTKVGTDFFAVGYGKSGSSNQWLVRQSSDSGATWANVDTYQLSTNKSASAKGVASNAGAIFVVGEAYDSSGKYHWVTRMSEDGGTTWETIDDYQLVAGRDALASAVATDASGNVYVIGYAKDGADASHSIVRKGSSDGTGWATVNDFAGVGYDILAHSTGIYIGTSLGIRRSTNAGASWAVADADTSTRPMYSLSTDASDTIYAAGSGYEYYCDYGCGELNYWLIRKSSDGTSWVSLAEPVSRVATKYASLIGSDGSALYVWGRTYSWPNWYMAAYRSTDGGATWTAMTASNLTAGLTAVTSFSNSAVGGQMIGYSTDSAGRYKWSIKNSADSGATWSTVSEYQASTNTASIANAVASDSSGNLYAAGDYVAPDGSKFWALRKSTDGGASWSTRETYQYTAGYASTAYAVAVIGSNLYVAGLGTTSSYSCEQLRKSTNGGGSFISVFNSCWSSNASTYAIGVDATYIYTVGHANSYWRVRRAAIANDTNWYDSDYFQFVSFKASYARAFARDSGNVLYVAGNGMDSNNYSHWLVRKSANGNSGTWSTVRDYQTDVVRHATAFAAATSGTTVFVAGEAEDTSGIKHWSVQKSTDSGSTWSIVSDYQYAANQPSSARGLVFDDAGNLYASGQGYDSSGIAHWIVRKSKDQGATWITIEDHQLNSGTATTPVGISKSANGDLFTFGQATGTDGVLNWLVRKAWP